MLPQIGFRLLLLAASSLLLSCRHPLSAGGPAADAPVAATRIVRASASADTPPEPDLVEAYAHYGAGVIAEMSNEPEEALEEYYQAALHNPQDETLVMAVSRRLLLARQLDKALEVATRATRRPAAPASAYARQAAIYSIMEKTEEAIQASRAAIRRDPRLLMGHQYLFLNYAQIGQEKRALGILNDAARVTGVDAEYLIGLAELYANYGARYPAEKEMASARAVAMLRRVGKAEELSPLLRLKLADGLELLGQGEEAAAIYRSLLEPFSEDPLLSASVRSRLANIYLRAEKPELAAEQLKALLRDHPTEIEAYYWLGRIACDAKEYGQAIEHFTKALLLKPDFQIGYYELARAQLGAKQDREALDTLGTAREKFQKNFVLEYLSALASAGQSDYTNAVNCFTAAEVVAAARETNRLTSDFYFQFGAACERMGDIAQAELHLQKCLRLAPNDAEALNYLGYMWADRGQKLQDARRMIEKALASDPENAAYLDSMGWVLFRLRQPQQALDYLLKAVRLSEPPDPTLYDHLGDVYASLGHKEQARDAWSKALSLEPGNEQVQQKVQSAAK